jgi:serine/threonine protein kinase
LTCSDIKPENVFLDRAGNVLLGDFGLSAPFNSSVPAMRARAGTIHYAAPEAFLSENIFGPELDIWSAGVVLYVMLRGRYPFWSTDETKEIRSILMAEPVYPAHFPAEVVDLLTKMLAKNPRQRITLAQLKRHAFVRNELKAVSLVQSFDMLTTATATAAPTTSNKLATQVVATTAVVSPTSSTSTATCTTTSTLLDSSPSDQQPVIATSSD